MIDISGASGRLKAIYTYLTTNLSPTRTAKIENLDTNILSRAPASTALSSGVWSQGHADKVALIETDPCSRPPILNGVIKEATGSTYSTTYVAILNITGSGVLNMVRGTNATATPSARISIDGVVVFDAFLQTASGGYAVGCGDVDKLYGLDQIPFRTSLTVEIKTSNASYQTHGYARYRKTS